MAFIVGCDINGYSRLSLNDQNLLTAHLAGCHIKSLANSRLNPKAFTDTGDGFFVVFDTSVGTSWENYVKDLCRFYYTECHYKIVPLSKSNWLKIAAGEGDVYITPQKGIRGYGINNIARILEACKLPVPLELEHGNSNTLLYVKDKHGNEHKINPMYINWPKGDNTQPIYLMKPEPSVTQTSNIAYDRNPFYLLKKPPLPSNFKAIDEFNWWSVFNEYVHLTDTVKNNYEFSSQKNGDWEKYISPVYITGHTLININERISAIAKLTGWAEKNGRDDPTKIRIIYLHPNSDFATKLKGEDGRTLRDKIIDSLESVRKLLYNSSNSALARRIEIAFSATPVSTGIHKLLDCMVLIHYGDDHRSHRAGYRFLSFFGSEQEEFKAHIDSYFDKLWNKMDSNGGKDEVNYIMNRIYGNEIEKFLNEQNHLVKGSTSLCP